LFTIANLRAQGMPPTHPYRARLSADVRKRVLELLKREVKEELVPHWELDRWRRHIRQQVEHEHRMARRTPPAAPPTPTGPAPAVG